MAAAIAVNILQRGEIARACQWPGTDDDATVYQQERALAQKQLFDALRAGQVTFDDVVAVSVQYLSRLGREALRTALTEKGVPTTAQCADAEARSTWQALAELAERRQQAAAYYLPVPPSRALEFTRAVAEGCLRWSSARRTMDAKTARDTCDDEILDWLILQARARGYNDEETSEWVEAALASDELFEWVRDRLTAPVP